MGLLTRERPEHRPRGSDPDFCTCGVPRPSHREPRKRARPERVHVERRVQHRSYGDPCTRCGQPAAMHRPSEDRRRTRRPPLSELPCVGIDGEGIEREPHRYVYLSAVDEHGRKLGSIEDAPGLDGLDTRACLDFLLGLRHADGQPVRRVFGFSIGYDVCKMLRELSAEQMGKLVRPETRRSESGRGHWPVHWTPEDAPSGGRYSIGFLRGRWTLRRQVWDRNAIRIGRDGQERAGAWATREHVTIWDTFSFHQASFVAALTDWEVGSAEQRSRIARMKEERGSWTLADWLDPTRADAIRRYCDEECALLGALTRKLLSACSDAGLVTTTLHGPGALAGGWLRQNGVQHLKRDPPEAMRVAVSRAFFGGRFECSRMGDVPGPVYTADISSAYPAAMLDFPCLVHGRWTRVTERRRLRGRIETARLALVHVRVRDSARARPDWGPLPWRRKDGAIVFPRGGVETWAWRDEYLAAAEHFGQVEALDAWVYETDCDCAPFAGLASLYRRRIELGADAAGRALKLAINSVFGKTAQSIGIDPPFRSLIWAGNTTSKTRAMLLSAFGVARARWSVVMFATDSVWSTVPLDGLPVLETGTGDLKKPLGAWTRKTYDGGAFICRPGLYFPLDPKEQDPKEFRTRGVARADFMRHAPRIREHFKASWRRDPDGVWYAVPYVIEDARPRFVGMKTSTRRAADGTWSRSEDCGEWVPSTFSVGFDPAPKRAGAMRDGRLVLRSDCAGPSAPYNPSIRSALAKTQQQQRETADEQPDGGYEEGDGAAAAE